MKYLVNGVEYTDLKEAEKAEKAFEEAKKKKEALAEVKKARADEIKEALSNLQKVETEAGNSYTEKVNGIYKQYKIDLAAAKAEYKDAVKEAQDKYDTLVREFIKDYGSYHMSYFNNGTNEEISISNIIDKMFNVLSF